MNRKIFNVAVSFALMFSMLGAVACTTAVDQSEKSSIRWTVQRT